MVAWYQEPITQSYGQNGEQGIDLGTYFGQPITALFGGKVLEAKKTDWGNGLSSGGLVEIQSLINGAQHGSYYLHLDSIASNIVPGATVTTGEYLGAAGGQTSGGNWPTSTQYSTGPHTEFGLDANFLDVKGIGQNIDPSPLISNAVSNGVGSGPNTSCGPLPSDWLTNYTSWSKWLACQTAVNVEGSTSTGSIAGDAGAAATSTAGSISSLANTLGADSTAIQNFFTDKNWWVRAGLFAGGVIFIILGLWLFIGGKE